MTKKILGLFILLLGVGFTFAFDIPAYDGYVTDVADVLSQQQEQELESQIYGFVQETSAQMGVLIIPSTEGEDISMFAVEVGNKRGVGEQDYDNGIVMVIAVDDRERFIAVGYGLEGTIPDAIAKRVGEAQFPDNFRAYNYYEGVKSAVDDIYAYIKNDLTVVHTYEASMEFSWENIDPEFLFVLFFIFAGALGKFITVPDPTDSKKRKMTTAGWVKFGIIGALVAGVLYRLLATIIGAILLAYAGVGILTLFTVLGFSPGGIMMMGGRGGGGFGRGSSFGGFGGGSFGGGGGGGSW